MAHGRSKGQKSSRSDHVAVMSVLCIIGSFFCAALASASGEDAIKRSSY